MDRGKDWLEQAERDLRFALSSLEDGYHEWTCFISQQAAEKAVKSLGENLKREYWGHSVRKILVDLSAVMEIPENLIEKGAVLDRYYIPARYPNGFETGAPKDYFFGKDAEEAVAYAGEIIEFCKGAVSR
ncbi:MAG: HEPN domain-containing protein [Deltaproteobacteria bacterium]|nr:HEPN domain-containing protein [Deltaproteobacteria bacterium]